MAPRTDLRAVGPLPDWHQQTPPAPESLKLFGTTWYSRGFPYWWRRLWASFYFVLVAFCLLGAWSGLVLLIANALPLLLRIVFYLLVFVVAVPWGLVGLVAESVRSRRIDYEPREPFTGSLGWLRFAFADIPLSMLVAFFFSLVEAPGEHRLRLRHEEAMRRWNKRQDRLRAHGIPPEVDLPAVPAPPAAPAPAPAPERDPLPIWNRRKPPQPESLESFGTTWLERGWPYWWRRARATAVSSLLAACSLLLPACPVVLTAEALSSPVRGYFVLAVVLAFASSAALSSVGEIRRERDPDLEAPLRPRPAASDHLRALSYLFVELQVGLLRSMLCSLVDAPGEWRARQRYEEAVRRWEQREQLRSHKQGH